MKDSRFTSHSAAATVAVVRQITETDQNSVSSEATKQHLFDNRLHDVVGGYPNPTLPSLNDPLQVTKV